MNSPEARERALSDFIGRLTAEIEPLQLRHNLAYWQASVTGDPAAEEEAARLDTAIRTILSRREAYGFLEAVIAAGGVADPLLARQLTLLRDAHRAQQIEPAMIERQVRLEKRLEGRFNAYRAELDGARVTDNDLRRVLVASDDPRGVPPGLGGGEADRRRGGARAARAGAAAQRVGARAGLRRTTTRCGSSWTSWTRPSCSRCSTTSSGARPRCSRPTSAASTRAWRPASASRPPDLRPWHYGDPFFQEAPLPDLDLDRYFTARPLEEVLARLVRRRRPRRARAAGAGGPLRAAGQVPARVLHVRGPRRGHPRAVQPAPHRVLDVHAAARVRARGLRPARRRVAALLPARAGAHPDDRGERDAVRAPDEGRGLARAARGGRAATRPARWRRPAPGPRGTGCSCRRGGCW